MCVSGRNKNYSRHKVFEQQFCESLELSAIRIKRV